MISTKCHRFLLICKTLPVREGFCFLFGGGMVCQTFEGLYLVDIFMIPHDFDGCVMGNVRCNEGMLKK